MQNASTKDLEARGCKGISSILSMCTGNAASDLRELWPVPEILAANRGKAIIDWRDANPFKESNALARRHGLGGCGFSPGASEVAFHEISIEVYSVKSNLTYCVQNFIAYCRFYFGIGLKPTQVLIQDANQRTGTLGSPQFALYQTKSYTSIFV